MVSDNKVDASSSASVTRKIAQRLWINSTERHFAGIQMVNSSIPSVCAMAVVS
jgi:hypothetical protein